MLVLNTDEDSYIMFLAVPPASGLHSDLECKFDTR